MKIYPKLMVFFVSTPCIHLPPSTIHYPCLNIKTFLGWKTQSFRRKLKSKKKLFQQDQDRKRPKFGPHRGQPNCVAVSGDETLIFWKSSLLGDRLGSALVDKTFPPFEAEGEREKVNKKDETKYTRIRKSWGDLLWGIKQKSLGWRMTWN